MYEGISKLLERAMEQGKINSMSDARIEINQHGNSWVSWRNTRRSFNFTVFQDGKVAIGLLGV